MSTFLVSLGVVAAAIAAVVHVVLSSPDQPATIQRQPSRAKGPDGSGGRNRRRAGRRAAPAPVPAPAVASPMAPALAAAGPVGVLADSDVMRLRVQPAKRTTMWVRIRSGVALIVLVAVLGALLALAVGAAGLGVALLVRSATA